MDNQPKFPNNLKRIREKEGLTIAELVELSKVSRTTIKNLEMERINSKPETKQKIVNALNNNPDKAQKQDHKLEDIFPGD